MNDDLGKRAELKIKEWLDRPDEGYCFDRIPDQMSGFFGSRNICDFTLYKYPEFYYIESKATWNDRFDFSNITDHQRKELTKKTRFEHVHCFIIVLFATDKRAFVFNITDINEQIRLGRKSLNIHKIDSWQLPYREIETVPNNMKQLLDYTGEIEDFHRLHLGG